MPEAIFIIAFVFSPVMMGKKPRTMNFVKRSLAALLLSFPFALGAHFFALLSTPLWWKVESWTGLEWAGGHGPREEILVTFWILGTAAAWLFAFCFGKRRRRTDTDGNGMINGTRL